MSIQQIKADDLVEGMIIDVEPIFTDFGVEVPEWCKFEMMAVTEIDPLEHLDGKRAVCVSGIGASFILVPEYLVKVEVEQ